MKMNTRITRNALRGFTLMELMVVIVILGILMGIAVFTFGGATDDAKYGSAKTEIAMMRQAIDRLGLTRGKFPQTLEEAREASQEKGFPLKDPWDRDYEYLPKEGGYYLGSQGIKPDDETDDVYYDTEYARIIDRHLGESPDEDTQ